VELVEAGDANVVVAYFDRLVRSLAVQVEVVERIERAGGAILAVDVGRSVPTLRPVGCRRRCSASSRSTTADRRLSGQPRRNVAP
jgi:hypothetical protein